MPVHEDTYKLWVAEGFKSACVTLHKKEWEKTFPTGIQAPYMDPDGDDVLDYIFIKG